MLCTSIPLFAASFRRKNNPETHTWDALTHAQSHRHWEECLHSGSECRKDGEWDSRRDASLKRSKKKKRRWRKLLNPQDEANNTVTSTFLLFTTCLLSSKNQIRHIHDLGNFHSGRQQRQKPLWRPYLPETWLDESAVARMTELLPGHLLFSVCRCFVEGRE